jgi:nitroimidazol reductase NimA-like FMN-containing flavoprotein (pyridoxamine 5'-phosphate oxidase superfamily)
MRTGVTIRERDAHHLPAGAVAMSDPRPVFAELDRAACDAVLDAGWFGRIAYTFRDRVDVEPIGYVHSDGWLYGRTSPGTKLLALQHHPWVAFEVDEVSGPFDWRSVVVRGTFHQLHDGGTLHERERYHHALETLETHMPGMFTGDDPVPHRTVIFGIAIHEVTGRSARSEAR